ncbi:MAG: precorrin-2 dehydrogenase/sirohydrochlorin ferrochelatase [Verrucomicrobiales bacterium]|jgi:precorrin-2 dehydrogenase/sirohydrochlorin ferrochelatase
MSDSLFSNVHPYPVNLRLEGKPVLVVGAGSVAVRKVGHLLEAGAEVTVVGPVVDDRLWGLVDAYAEGVSPASLHIEERSYRRSEVAAYMLAITCTDDAEVNRQAHADGVVAGVWVNSADDPDNCDFTLMSVVRRGDLQFTISTGGRTPALAVYLRRRLEEEFTEEWAAVVDLLSEARDEVRDSFGTSEIASWHEAIDDLLFDVVVDGRIDRARDRLRSHLGLGVAA